MKIQAELGSRGGVLDGVDYVHQVCWPGFVVRGGIGGRELHTGMGIALFGDNCVVLRVPGVAGSTRLRTFRPLGLIAAPRLGTLFATWVLTFGPSGVMDALRLGTSFATRVWTFGPSGLMTAPRPGTLFATQV